MFREYAAAIGEDFWRGGFDEELAALPGYYDVLLVARDDAGALVGSVAIKRLPDGSGELKRLYVRPSARGTGVADRLIEACLEECRRHRAAKLGWQTAPDNARAQAVYERVGATRDEWADYWLAVSPDSS